MSSTRRYSIPVVVETADPRTQRITVRLAARQREESHRPVGQVDRVRASLVRCPTRLR